MSKAISCVSGPFRWHILGYVPGCLSGTDGAGFPTSTGNDALPLVSQHGFAR
jgi:hypothetical protein